MTNTQKKQAVQLIDGTFTAAEARDLITALIDQKINFHKVQRLSIWEGNSGEQADFPNGRIVELARDKQETKKFLSALKQQGLKVRISGTLEIEVEA
jgi:hypothetical protein